MLTLAREDATTEQLKLEEWTCAVIEELDAGSKMLADTCGVQWTTEIPKQHVAVLGDRALLRRLLLILIENACRYTETGGSVQLRLSVQEKTVIEVIDTGIGIPPDELTHVFDRFYCASNARFFDTARCCGRQ